MNNTISSQEQLNELTKLLDIIKVGITKKEHEIYEKLLFHIHRVTFHILPQINIELEEFKKNDSDNEDNYSESIRNIKDTDDIDSVSEYEIETDDENEEHNELEEKLKLHDKYCEEIYLSIKNTMYFEI